VQRRRRRPPRFPPMNFPPTLSEIRANPGRPRSASSASKRGLIRAANGDAVRLPQPLASRASRNRLTPSRSGRVASVRPPRQRAAPPVTEQSRRRCPPRCSCRRRAATRPANNSWLQSPTPSHQVRGRRQEVASAFAPASGRSRSAGSTAGAAMKRPRQIHLHGGRCCPGAAVSQADSSCRIAAAHSPQGKAASDQAALLVSDLIGEGRRADGPALAGRPEHEGHRSTAGSSATPARAALVWGAWRRPAFVVLP